MIVYNAGRRWFTHYKDAEKHRVFLGLKPGATLAIQVAGREDLTNLLNALCEPPLPKQPIPRPATPELVDRAFVAPSRDIPEGIPNFLLKDWGLEKPK